MMTDVTITHQDEGAKGRYVGRVAGASEHAEMTYSRASDALIIVDHTDVPEALRGAGVGAALAAHIVEEARAKGFKIMPLCPFFASQYKRHPEWSDVIRG